MKVNWKINKTHRQKHEYRLWNLKYNNICNELKSGEYNKLSNKPIKTINNYFFLMKKKKI